MSVYGYHCSHEQFSPVELLHCVQLAEEAGFKCASASDHFHPWNERPWHAAFVWTWLGAAMQSTHLPFRTVSAPGYRYHPAVLAQAGATLAFMYPDRLWMALGSGQRLNEAITGLPWPAKAERNARLRECADVIRALWAGETVTHRGLIVVEEAKLYTRPESPPLIVGAAVSPETARWLGGWADGLITVAGGPAEAVKPIIDAFREGGGEGKPVLAQAKVAWGSDETELRHDALAQWGTNLFAGDVPWELRTPEQFEKAAAFVREADLDLRITISSDLGRHVEQLHAYAALGIDEILIHNVASNQRAFIEAFGRHVLPQLRNS
ncbi:TIGR03885 family FMN-dependent LLM class oxidoreductase [Microvirga arabica]|uniref:TIGR03885 family FMN-dependent LLM class oxidoreductase n=1 Tax=Microvirga arabica TaxID=1128671 RepID=A0ABV6Y7C4_9HYPH